MQSAPLKQRIGGVLEILVLASKRFEPGEWGGTVPTKVNA
jgi:hypothetical protein